MKKSGTKRKPTVKQEPKAPAVKKEKPAKAQKKEKSAKAMEKSEKKKKVKTEDDETGDEVDPNIWSESPSEEEEEGEEEIPELDFSADKDLLRRMESLRPEAAVIGTIQTWLDAHDIDVSVVEAYETHVENQYQ